MGAGKGSAGSKVKRSRRPPKLVESFYESVLSEAERTDIERARRMDGLDEEIAVLRLRLRSALEEHPENLALMAKGVDLLVKALSARYRLSKGDRKEVSERIKKTLEEIGGGLVTEASGDGA